MVDITRDKVNPQEPPSDIPIGTSGQPMEQTIVDTSTKVDSTDKITTTVEEPENDQKK